MKKAILIIFLFISKVSYEQSVYSSHINKAELNFIDKKYQEALVNFSLAFSSKSNVYGKDYYNAALCALRTKDFKKTFEYLDSLCSNGYPIKKISKNINFETFIKTIYYKQMVKKKYRLSLFKKKNSQFLYKLLSEDQRLRLKNPRNYMNTKDSGDIDKIDSINVKMLNEFIEKNGFPNEFNCGIDSNNINFNPSEIIIIHQQFGSSKRIYNYSEIVLNAIKEENILPHYGLNLHSTCAGGDSIFANDCFFSIEQPDGKYKNAYFSKINNEEKINLKRLSYNLEILDDYKKKMFYFLKYDDFIFDFSIGRNIQTISKSLAPYLKDLTYFE